MLDMTGLDDGLPAIGEIPKCSDTQVLSISIVLRGTVLCKSFRHPVF